MTITFLCPNGHKLNCPDDKAGRSARCPDCGVAFRVPSPNSATIAPAPAAGRPAASPPGESMAFLCPNGHRVVGPVAWVGRPGKCPHCGVAFRIPEPVEHEAAGPSPEPFDREPEWRRTEGPELPGASDPLPFAAAAVATAPLPAGGLETVSIEPLSPWPVAVAGGSSAVAAKPDSSVHVRTSDSGGLAAASWPRIFDRLWRMASPGSLQLTLEGGELVVPDKYSPQLSQADFGVFMLANPQGATEVAAIRWSTITRVSIRGSADVPAALFE